MLRPRLRRWWVVWTALAAAVSCSESPFEPRGEGERVPIGLVIEDQVSGDTVNWYSFAAAPNQLFAVFLDASQGSVQLAVYDSTHQTLVATMRAYPNGPALDENPTNTFGGTATGAVYRLRLNSVPLGSTGRFRFKVYGIDVAPERLPGSFTFGDTVTGETIDPMVDLDRFRAHGDEGQEIVGVLETQGPAGSGSVALDVVDTATNNLLGYVFADASTSNPLTTGRMRLSGAHDYLFTLGSVTSNQYPLYRGPYRFWTYVINRAPEHRAAPIPVDVEIGNERIDRAGDVDEFTFQAAGGDHYNAFVQGGGRTFQLEVAPQGGTTFAIATSQASDTALFAHATNRFQIATAGTYVVRVTATNPYQVADTGAYRLYLYAIDRRPEHAPAAITAGDTVSGEDIGLPGDIDEFTFNGAAGEEFNAFLQAQNGSTETRLQLDVVDVGGAVLRSAQSSGTDTSLLRQVTGRFALPSAGTYRLRVTGEQSWNDQDRGAYRLFLYRVDRKPESVPVVLAVGDSMSGESIDVPGDVDEYRVVVGETTGVNLVATLDAQPEDGTPVTVQLFDPNGVQVTGLFGYTVPTEAGRTRLEPGVYKLRVDVTHYQDKPTFRGPYRVWLYAFDYTPELVSDTVAIGDTVSGEVIAPWGDVDRFHFYGLRGQHVNVALQGRADTAGGGFQAWISGPGGAPVWTFASVSSAASDPTLREHQTRRLDLPVSGWYDVEITGFGPTRGAYRLLVERLGTAPETVGSALVPGDSVTSEALDPPGDWDEYTVTAAPSQELSVLLESDRWNGPFPYLVVFDRDTGDSLAGAVGQLARLAGPFRLPASGEATLAVRQPAGFVRFCYDATCGGLFGSAVIPYRLRVIPINRAPESVPPRYAVGDTLRGEAIWPTADIDEFTSSGTPGEQLAPFYRLAAPATPDGGLITLEVIDPATGVALVGSNAAVFGTTFFSPGSFTVPAGGSFVVRLRAYGYYGENIATAPYEFFIKRGP